MHLSVSETKRKGSGTRTTAVNSIWTNRHWQMPFDFISILYEENNRYRYPHASNANKLQSIRSIRAYRPVGKAIEKPRAVNTGKTIVPYSSLMPRIFRARSPFAPDFLSFARETTAAEAEAYFALAYISRPRLTVAASFESKKSRQISA